VHTFLYFFNGVSGFSGCAHFLPVSSRTVPKLRTFVPAIPMRSQRLAPLNRITAIYIALNVLILPSWSKELDHNQFGRRKARKIILRGNG
jgi:hypothetical protein